MDQPGKAADPARDQLNRENEHFAVPVRGLRILSRKTSSAVPSSSACPFSTLRLNLALTYGIPPISAAASIYSSKPPYAIGSVPSLSPPRKCVPMMVTAESPSAQGQ